MKMKTNPMNERGFIEIKRDEQGQTNVEILLADHTLWLSKQQMADLLEVRVSVISNSLQTIIQSGILQEEAVSCVHKDGRQREVILYNLDAFFSVCFRINSQNAEAVREWAMKTIWGFCRFKYQELIRESFGKKEKKYIVS